MQMIGKKSLSSKLNLALNIFYYISIIMEAVLFTGIIAVLFIGETNIARFIEYYGGGHLKMQVSGLSFAFTGNFPTMIFPKLILSVLMVVIITNAIGILIIYQLRRIFASFTEYNPFKLENVKRIRRIGILTITGSLIYSLCEFVVFKIISGYIRINGLDINVSFSINWTVIFLGLVIVTLAEVFRLGFELQEDKNLTI